MNEPLSRRILKNYTAALAHKLRSPLSAISNELAYLETLVDPTECALAKKMCGSIAQLLTQYTTLEMEVPPGRSLRAMFEALGLTAATLSDTEPRHSDLLYSALKLWLDIPTSKGSREILQATESSGAWQIVISTAESVPEHAERSEFLLFSDWYSAALGRDLPQAALIDALLADAGVTVSISGVDGQFVAELEASH